MKAILMFVAVAAVCLFSGNRVNAEEQERKVDTFSEISLRIPGNLYLTQGSKQHIEIVAKASMLDEIITEVKDRKLVIRFPKKNYLWKEFEHGKITIYVTVPEIDALSISGSGDIIAEDKIDARILDLAVSGSGDMDFAELKAERVKVAISGSGNIKIKGEETATDLSAAISGSGNLKASDFPVEDVMVKVAGSGNSFVYAKNKLTVKVAGSGDVRYKGKPQIDKTVVGSGSVKEIID